ncbi:MAG: 1-acyl-sn-glycerol-3-phosphate acyltransferase [Bacteroidota bacterium]|nr:MAG: 1-acyl-sn-glycerol-3-phosphate acyltransferase [Bacteroidota bacterium]
MKSKNRPVPNTQNISRFWSMRFLWFFPRTSDGQMGDFKQTFAILACELKVPVIPVAISGSYDALPAGKSFPRLFRKVKVSFLPTVNPENLSYKEVMEKVQALVFGQLNSAKA